MSSGVYIRNIDLNTGKLVRYGNETRFCRCNCGKTFICKTNSKQRFLPYHHSKVIKLLSFGGFSKDKFSMICNKSVESRRKNGFISGRKGKQYVNREIRFCKCDCGKSKEVKVNSRWRYFKGHQRRGKTISEIYGKIKSDLFRNKISMTLKNRYKNLSDYDKEIFLKNGIHKTFKHPNKFELKCKDLLNIYYPNEFEYCGQGKTIIINGRNPDFIHKTKKIVILCHGIYWHMKKFGIEDTIENRRVIELEDSKPFRAYGYEVWVIWEDRIQLNKVVIVNTKEEVKQDVEKVCIGG